MSKASQGAFVFPLTLAAIASLLSSCNSAINIGLRHPASTDDSTQTPITAPSSVPGELDLELTLLSPQTQELAPFSFGQPFRQGQVPAGSEIVSSLPGFQATIKSRWPDGSAKFAILSGRASLQANVPLVIQLQKGSASPGLAPVSESDLIATGVEASITFSPFGAAHLRPLLGVASTYDPAVKRWSAGRVTSWVSGPEMSSWIYYSPIGTDAHLAAWFEVRMWRGGAVEILPWIENGYLNVDGLSSKAGAVSFDMGGVTRFSSAIDLPDHSRAVLASGTVFTHWLGTDPQVQVKHDASYFQATRLVPPYFGKTPSTAPALANLVTSYTPLAQASFPTGMGSAGYHPSIGLLPQWDVLYLTSGADPRAFKSAIVNAYSAGRYAIHYRDETTHRPLRFSQYPNLVLSANGVPGAGASSKGQYTPKSSGTVAATWASSHHPSVGYMAYLLTGRYYFLEEIQFAATLHYLKQTDTARQFSNGVLLTNSGSNTTRGAAWALRTLVQAATATPDEDAVLRSELLASIEANINYYHSRYVAQPNNPQGICTPYSDYTTGDGKYMHAIWMEDFFTAAWGYALDLDLGLAPEAQTKLREFFNWKSRSIVGRFGNQGSATEYNFRDAATYTLAVAPSDTVNWANGTGPWYSDWGQIYEATKGQSNVPSADTSLRGGYFPEGSSYWGNLQPALAYAVIHRAPGAVAAYQRASTASNWNQILASWNLSPEWGVSPEGR